MLIQIKTTDQIRCDDGAPLRGIVRRLRGLVARTIGLVRDGTLLGVFAPPPKRWRFHAAKQTLVHSISGAELCCIGVSSESVPDSVLGAVVRSSLKFVARLDSYEYAFVVRRMYIPARPGALPLDLYRHHEIWRIDHGPVPPILSDTAVLAAGSGETNIRAWRRLSQAIADGLQQFPATDLIECPPTYLMFRGGYLAREWDSQLCSLISVGNYGQPPREWMASALSQWLNEALRYSGSLEGNWRFQPHLKFPRLINIQTGAFFRCVGVVERDPREPFQRYGFQYGRRVWPLEIAFDAYLGGNRLIWSFDFNSSGYVYRPGWHIVFLLVILPLLTLFGLLTLWRRRSLVPSFPPYNLCRAAYEDLLESMLLWPTTDCPEGPPRVVIAYWQHYGEQHARTFGRIGDLIHVLSEAHWQNRLTRG